MSLPIDLHLYITLRCNAACRLCNVDSSPERGEEMDVDAAQSCVADVLRLGAIEHLNITGGEPLLHPDKVLGVARYADSRGVRTSITTNGFWGAREEEATALLMELRKAGAKHLWISADAFHAEFVPLATVKKALRAASGQRIAFYVQSTYLFPEADVFGAQGIYNGPLHNDYDRRTRAIQEELSAVLRPGSYGWGRVIFRGRAVSLKACLGDDLARAEQFLAKALQSLPNRDGKVGGRLVICVFPGGKIDINGEEIASGGDVNAAVRKWCSQRGVAL